jgi:single-stranded-DNA-specific exonuclease
MSHLSPQAFLGVENSLAGRRWVARLDRAGEAQALAIAQAHGIADVVARVLAGRGVDADTAPAYLNPTLRELLPEPFSLRDMERAATRLAKAIADREKIAIFGDYDVDGACSAALLATFAAKAGAPAPLIHIPDRIREGYGPNVEAVRDLHAKGARLMVAVDCGSTSFEALAEAQALGMETIVLDHHQIGEELPAGLIVNPNRQDDASGAGALCAAGVVFLTIVAASRELRRRGHWAEQGEPDLLEALDLVALATVADVAPLVGLNRAFVAKGLAVMRQRRRVGLAALMDAAQLEGPPRPYDLGFLLGPRINAGGRIGDAALGARLLTLQDPSAAREIAEELNRLNAERRRLEEIALEQAVVAAERELESGKSSACLVIGDSAWRPGLVGLLASRLKDRFKIPSFAIAFNEDSHGSSYLASGSSSCLTLSWGGAFATGSGRSLPGVDLGRAVRRAVAEKIAAKGGGHAMAAGVTIAQDRFGDFREFMNAALKAEVEACGEQNILRIDAAMTARGAGPDLVDELEKAGPYGQGAAEPVFAFAEHGVDYVSPVGAGHLRLRLRSGDGAALDAICFRAVGTKLGEALARSRGERFHFAARLTKSAYRGVARVTAQIVDLAPSGSAL